MILYTLTKIYIFINFYITELKFKDFGVILIHLFIIMI